MTRDEQLKATDRATALAAALDDGKLLASEVMAAKIEHARTRTDLGKDGVTIPVYVDRGKTK